MIKEQQNQNKEDENDLYLIPNRKIVSYKILEAYYNMVETFSVLVNNKESTSTLKRMNRYITNLYILIKDYEHITDKINEWDKFSKEMETCITNGSVGFNYKGAARIMMNLSNAVYKSGLTKIEWEKENLSESILEMGN